MAFAATPDQTCVPLPTESGKWNKHPDHEALLSLAPVHILTHASQLPIDFLYRSRKAAVLVLNQYAFVDSTLHYSRVKGSCKNITCLGFSFPKMKLAFPDAIYLVHVVQGGRMFMKACKPALESSYITEVFHDCKRDSEALYFQFGIKANCSPSFAVNITYYLIEEQLGWKRLTDDYISFVGVLTDSHYCDLSEQMVRVAMEDVLFLPNVYYKMMEKLTERSLWELAVRGNAPEWEILSVFHVPPGKMGCSIDRKGSSIFSEILVGGAKGPPDKISL
ncbi:hypothetical protein NMG60_11004164 [Bertholletia excelsa]